MRLGVSSNGNLTDRKSNEFQMSGYALRLDFGQVKSGAPTRTRTWNLMLRRHVHYPVVLWARRLYPCVSSLKFAEKFARLYLGNRRGGLYIPFILLSHS